MNYILTWLIAIISIAIVACCFVYVGIILQKQAYCKQYGELYYEDKNVCVKSTREVP